MNKKFIALILTLIFAIIICGNSSATDWTVGPGGKYNYTTIQSAVNGANSDDTITVYDDGGNPYTYQENVVINKNNLTVTGNGQVTVSGSSNPSNPVFTVNSGSSLATIGGFNITGATNSAGVYIEGTSGVTLSNLNISECRYGVEVSGSHVLLDNVSVSNVSSVGVYLIGDVSDLTIQNCYINDSGTPIYKDRSKITSTLLSIDPTMKLIEVDDGIFCYFLDIPTIHGMGFALDHPGYGARKSGHFLAYCGKRGFNTIASLQYLRFPRSDLSSDHIAAILKKSYHFKLENLNKYHFRVIYIHPESGASFVRFTPKSGAT